MQETPYDCDKKGSALRPDHPKIVPTSKRDLAIIPVRETSGLDYVFCSMERNLCGLRGLERFRDFFFFTKVREVKKENLSVLCVTVNPDLITLRDLIEHFSLFCYLCRE